MKVGRPSKFKHSLGEKLIRHMAKGLSVMSFCINENIPYTTFYDWVHKHPTLAKDFSIAKCKYVLFWEQIGLMAMVGKIKINNRMYQYQIRRTPDWFKDMFLD